MRASTLSKDGKIQRVTYKCMNQRIDEIKHQTLHTLLSIKETPI